MTSKRNYYLYILGLFISLFGTNIYTFAIGLYVLNLTGSAVAFSTTLIVGILPTIFIGPLTGVFVDHHNKKNIVVLADFFNGLLFVILFIISRQDLLILPVIYTTTFVVSLITTLFNTAMESSKIQLFKKDTLSKINASSQVIRSSAIILGPLLGGLAFAFVDISLFILINAVSFLSSSIIEYLLIYPTYKRISNLDSTRVLTEFHKGLKYIKLQKELHPFILFFIILNFISGFSINVPLPYIINTTLQRPAALLGSIEAFFPIGMLIGGLCITKLLRKHSVRKIFMRSLILFILLLVGCFIPSLMTPNTLSNTFLLLYYGLIHFLFGIGISFVDIPIMTLLQERVVAEYFGRVLSLVMAMVKTIYPIGLALSGLLTNKISPFLLPVMGAFIMFIFSIYFSSSLRQNTSLKLGIDQ